MVTRREVIRALGIAAVAPSAFASTPLRVLRQEEAAEWTLREVDSLRELGGESRGFPFPERTDLASVSKTFCAYAALRTDVLREDERVVCDGDGFRPEGHGKLTVVDALATSCNCFFERVGTRIGWDDYRDACARLGGLEARLPARPSTLPGRVDVYAHGAGFLAGLEELARLARAVALADPGDEALAVVRRGWRAAVVRGTAIAASVEGIPAAGKTGTVPGSPVERKLALFAPEDAPRWIVAVRVAGMSPHPAEIAARVLRERS